MSIFEQLPGWVSNDLATALHCKETLQKCRNKFKLRPRFEALLHPFLQQESGDDDDEDGEEAADDDAGDGAAGKSGIFIRIVRNEDGRELDGIRKLAGLVRRVVGLHGQVVDRALVESASRDFKRDLFSGFDRK